MRLKQSRIDLNMHIFNMATKKKNKSKIITKDISCKCKGFFDGRKCNSNQKWNNDKCGCERKKHNISEKHYIWNPATCSTENGKYLTSIIENSVITCDEIIGADAEAKSYNEEKETVPANFNEKKQPVRRKVSVLFSFLLTTILLLMAVSIYGYLIKYWVEQKHLLLLHITNNKLKI